jgi:hypothetical protein
MPVPKECIAAVAPFNCTDGECPKPCADACGCEATATAVLQAFTGGADIKSASEDRVRAVGWAAWELLQKEFTPRQITAAISIGVAHVELSVEAGLQAPDSTAPCPYPITGDDGTAKQCIERGHCGCDEAEKP